MSVCDVPVISAVCDTVGQGAATLIAAPFDWLAQAMGGAAAWLFEAVWTVFDTTTLVDVTDEGYVGVYNILFGVAVFVVLIFFCLQLITGLVHRDPTALTRAALGAAKSILGSFVAIGLTGLLLEITDQLAVGIVQATGNTMESIGDRITLLAAGFAGINIAAPGVGAIVTIFLAGLAISAAAIVWFSLLIRKALLLVAIVFAPIALAGFSWDATKGWFGKWATFVIALILSKLVLVVIFLVAITQVSAPIELDLASISDPIAGVVLMFIAAFAPYMTYKFVTFIGFDMYHSMSAEQEAKSALNRPIPVPSAPKADGTKKVLDGADNGGGAAPPSEGTPPATTATPATGGGAAGGSGAAAGAGAGSAGGGAGAAGAGAGGAAAAGPAAAVVVGAQVVGAAATAGPKLGGKVGGAAEGHAAGAGETVQPAPPPAPNHTPTAPPARPTPSTPPPVPSPKPSAGKEQSMSTQQNTSSAGFGLRAVQFSRLTRRGILLGLSLPQLIALATGVLSIVGALYAGGGILLAWTAPIWLLSAVLAWTPVGGRKLIEWVPVTFRWVARTQARQTVFRRRVVKPRPAGTLALPGDAASLREWEDPETGAAMIHDPHHQTLTAIVGVSHPAFVLLDPGEQERRVATWGRVLATTCRSGRIARLQVCERTLPDGGSGLVEWWQRHGTDDGSWTSTVYRELIDRAGPAGERHATTISLALDLKASARQVRTNGGGIKGAAAVLRQEMTTLVTAFRAAELTITGWLTPAQVAVILRSAYDPATAAILERNTDIGRSLATAGPVAVTESWDRLRSDSAHHAVLWVSEWPRSQVYPGFLAPVLLSSGIQRSFSLVCTPIRSDQAARDIRKKKTELISDAAQRQKMGQIEDASQTAEYGDVLQQEADLTAGHGVLRYTGLISVSAPSPEELDTAVAAIEQAAIQASCETRRLVGQQAQAFTVAALPLCRTV